jgi:hypothetical protein
MIKKHLHFIGMFLILFGLSITILSAYSPMRSNADENDDMKRISDQIKEDIKDYNDLLARATEESSSCQEVNDENYTEMSLLDFIETKSVDQHTCLKEISYNIDKIKREYETTQIVDTYHMLDTKLSSINEVLSQTLDLTKETNKNRKSYSQ